MAATGGRVSSLIRASGKKPTRPGGHLMSRAADSSKNENESTYVINAEDAAEMARLLDQDKLAMEVIGGIFPERTDLSNIYDVLDIGCGPGGWVHEVAHAYPEVAVTGIDISKRMIEYAHGVRDLMLFGLVPPGGKYPPAFYEVRLLHLASRLLGDSLMVVWHTCPFAQERQECPKYTAHVLIKALSFDGPSTAFPRIGARLYKLDSILVEESC